MISMQRVSPEQSPQPTRPPDPAVEIPRVMVVGPDSAELKFLQRFLQLAGYWVDNRTIGSQSMVRLRSQFKTLFGTGSLEFLVLDGAGDPDLAAQVLDLIRELCPSLPIILIAGSDLELRKEARRVAVDIIIDAPVTIAALRRAARELAPSFPDLRSDRHRPSAMSRGEPRPPPS